MAKTAKKATAATAAKKPAARGVVDRKARAACRALGLALAAMGPLASGAEDARQAALREIEKL